MRRGPSWHKGKWRIQWTTTDGGVRKQRSIGRWASEVYRAWHARACHALHPPTYAQAAAQAAWEALESHAYQKPDGLLQQEAHEIAENAAKDAEAADEDEEDADEEDEDEEDADEEDEEEEEEEEEGDHEEQHELRLRIKYRHAHRHVYRYVWQLA